MDRDYDGRLTFGEFMGEETPLEKVFKSMDRDGDGTVTKEVGDNIISCKIGLTLQEFGQLCKHLTPKQVGDRPTPYITFKSMY